MYYGRVISISCLRMTPFWHGCYEIKFFDRAPKKIVKWFLESLFKSKNLCRNRILIFLLISDLQKRTPKLKNVSKNAQNRLQNAKNIIKNQKKCSKIKITKEVEIHNFDSKKKIPIATAFQKYFYNFFTVLVAR